MGTKRSGSLLRILMYVWIEVILWQPDKFIITELMAMHECGQSGTCLFGTGLCVSTRLFTLNTLIISFHWIYLWIHVWHRDKNPQLAWRFSANRSKASFNSVHRSAVKPGLNAVFSISFSSHLATEIMQNTLCNSPFTIPQCLEPLESKLSQNLYMAARD